MVATYGWSHSVQEMGNILQLDLGPYSVYSEMNSSIVIVTILLLWSLTCECVKFYPVYLPQKKKSMTNLSLK